MKCPKCSYTSFDYLKECKKCGENLKGSRLALNLKICEPALFTNLYINQPENVVLNQTEPSFTGSSAPENRPTEDGEFILENKFTVPDKTEKETISVTDHPSEDFSGLGNFGTGDKTEPGVALDVDDFNHNLNSDEPKVDNLDDFEFTSSFADKSTPIEAPGGIELNSLEIDKLDLFIDQPDTSETTPKIRGTNEVDIDSKVDHSLKNSGNLAENGSIELELDMNDDMSLDELLADLEKKA